MDEFCVGAASVDISPDQPRLMKVTGLHELNPTLGVLAGHELYADALAFRIAGQRVVVATFDAVACGTRRDADIRRIVVAKTGIDPTRVIVAARHNHSAGAVPVDEKDPLATPAVAQYYRKIRDGVADACVQALADLAPGEIAAATVNIAETVGQSRRIRHSHGACTTGWNSGPVAIPGERFGPAPGPDSTRIDFLSARRLGQRDPFALLTSYASHIHLGAIPYFNGEMVTGVRAALHRRFPGLHVIYATKTGGDLDMHCVHPMPNDPREKLAWYRRATAELGRRFTAPILSALPTLHYSRPAVFAHAHFGAELDPTPPATATSAPATTPATTPSPRPFCVNAVRLGHLALASIPSELFMDHINRIHARSPFPNLILLGFNGTSGMGYMGTPIAFEQGGYETGPEIPAVRPRPTDVVTAGRVATNRYRANLGETALQKIDQLLHQLAARA